MLYFESFTPFREAVSSLSLASANRLRSYKTRSWSRRASGLSGLRENASSSTCKASSLCFSVVRSSASSMRTSKSSGRWAARFLSISRVLDKLDTSSLTDYTNVDQRENVTPSPGSECERDTFDQPRPAKGED